MEKSEVKTTVMNTVTFCDLPPAAPRNQRYNIAEKTLQSVDDMNTGSQNVKITSDRTGRIGFIVVYKGVEIRGNVHYSPVYISSNLEQIRKDLKKHNDYFCKAFMIRSHSCSSKYINDGFKDNNGRVYEIL